MIKGGEEGGAPLRLKSLLLLQEIVIEHIFQISSHCFMLSVYPLLITTSMPTSLKM